MAVIPATPADVSTLDRIAGTDHHAHTVTWGPIANGDTCDALVMPYSADRSIQITGSFAGAGSILFEGSNDGTNYATLVDVFNVPLVFTAADLRQIIAASLYVRPRMTAGSGTLTAIVLLLRRP